MNSTEGMKSRQVGGQHYSRDGMTRWALLDFAVDRGYDIHQFVMLRYLDRWKLKDGLEDLIKMRDYLNNYIDRHTPKEDVPNDMKSRGEYYSQNQ